MIIDNLHSAIFLDRDGVIIENRRDYVRDWSDVSYIPGSMEALRLLSFTSHKVIVITNQSVVGRGLIGAEDAEAINARLQREVEDLGGRIDGIFMCPHAPSEGCSCRKPEPGLIEQAAAEHKVDLGRSLLIGDAISDLEAGWAAGIPRTCLVETGRGRDQIRQAAGLNLPSFLVFSDLLEATIWSVSLKNLGLPQRVHRWL